MNFNDHSNLTGKHAYLSPSKPIFLKETDERTMTKRDSLFRKTLGTIIHEYAADQIDMRIKATGVRDIIKGVSTNIYRQYCKNHSYSISDNYELRSQYLYGMNLIDRLKQIPKETFAMVVNYINDGISFKMTPEQVLYYSSFCFGTADTICFRNNTLRIHDLKTGDKPADIGQLLTYAALFCLEYDVRPGDIQIVLRFYQRDNFIEVIPTTPEIAKTMDIISHKSDILKQTGGGYNER